MFFIKSMFTTSMEIEALWMNGFDIRCSDKIINIDKTLNIQINPSILKTWRKYFDSYTYSFVRRIDERE